MHFPIFENKLKIFSSDSIDVKFSKYFILPKKLLKFFKSRRSLKQKFDNDDIASFFFLRTHSNPR